MKRVVVMASIMLVHLAAAANAQDASAAAAAAPAAERVQPRAEPDVSDGPVQGSTTAPQTAPVAPPRPPDLAPRRRGSMVGYIDDAIVGSKVRIRFDDGLHNHAPDRAEFFYAKCGCYRDLPKNNPSYDPAAPGPRPGAAGDLNFQQVYLLGEYAVVERLSGFVELPARWIQPQTFIPNTGAGFSNQAGISDLRAGVKIALLANSGQVLTVQLRGFLPTGQASSGLGTNHGSLEPTLLWYQRVSNRLALESQIGDWHPFGGSTGLPSTKTSTFAGDVFSYGIGPSYELYRSDRVRFAPVLELVGWRVLGGSQTGTTADATGIDIVNLKIGARTSWDNSSLYVGYGHALTSASWYENIVRLEYRYSF